MPMTITVDLRDVFEAAQGYVMLGRPEKLEQLFIVEKLDATKLYSDSKVREEHEKMKILATGTTKQEKISRYVHSTVPD